LQTLRGRGFRIHGLWFNPNIHPFTEYRSRLDALVRLQELWGLDIEYAGEYGLTGFLRNVVNHEEDRCRYCYFVRLEAAAAKAKELGADAFTTTLLVSPYQNFELIREAGRELQEKYAVEFYYEDFRPGFAEGRRISLELGLYRQKYCGCIYSEMERYCRRKKKAAGGGETDK
jgi:predicted adenine nucleotide alpha hydrolase (AANH) superfamily ATPase